MKRVILFAALIAWSQLASAVVYKWVDAQGKLQYGDNPPDGVHAEVVELLGTHSARSAAAAPAANSTVSAKAATDPDAKSKEKVKDEVAQDVAASNDKQCGEAQQRYKQLIEGRRLFKTGPDGQRQYLTSEEIDSQRLAAKSDIDNFCGGNNG